MPNISYSDVLEDLEQKRQSLDAAIAAIRRIYEVFPETAQRSSANQLNQAHISEIGLGPFELTTADEVDELLRSVATNGHAKPPLVPAHLLEGNTVRARAMKFLTNNPGPHHTRAIALALKSTYQAVSNALAKAVTKGYVTRTAPGNFAAL